MRNRPAEPAIACQGVGDHALLATRPQLNEKLSAFLQQLMRGPSVLTPVQREGIMAAVSLSNQVQWCYGVHREACFALAGGQDEAMAELSDHAFGALGAFSVMVNNGEWDARTVDHAKEHWPDEALHDVAMIVGAANLLNVYVEGLAARTPDPTSNEGAAIYKAVGERLANQGYG